MIAVDANVIAYLYLPSEYMAAADALLDSDSELAAPALGRSEFRRKLAARLRRASLRFQQACQRQPETEQPMPSGECKIVSFGGLKRVCDSERFTCRCALLARARQLGSKRVALDGKLPSISPGSRLGSRRAAVERKRSGSEATPAGGREAADGEGDSEERRRRAGHHARAAMQAFLKVSRRFLFARRIGHAHPRWSAGRLRLAGRLFGLSLAMVLPGQSSAQSLSAVLDSARAGEPTWLSAKVDVELAKAKTDQAFGALSSQSSASGNTNDNDRQYLAHNSTLLPAKDRYHSKAAPVSPTQPIWRYANIVGWQPAEAVAVQGPPGAERGTRRQGARRVAFGSYSGGSAKRQTAASAVRAG